MERAEIFLFFGLLCVETKPNIMISQKINLKSILTNSAFVLPLPFSLCPVISVLKFILFMSATYLKLETNQNLFEIFFLVYLSFN